MNSYQVIIVYKILNKNKCKFNNKIKDKRVDL